MPLSAGMFAISYCFAIIMLTGYVIDQFNLGFRTPDADPWT